MLGKKLSRFLSFTLRVFPTDPLRGDFLGGIAMGLDAIGDIHAGGLEALEILVIFLGKKFPQIPSGNLT